MGACCGNRTIEADIMTCMDMDEIISVMKYYYENYEDEWKELENYLDKGDDIEIVKEIKHKVIPKREIKKESLKVKFHF